MAANDTERARELLPLRRVMEQYGHAPAHGRWKDFPCPFCHHKSGAGIFEGKHGDRFKCHHASCPSGTAAEGAAFDETGYIAFQSGLSRKEAYKQWLKMAGVWKETHYAPSVLPGKQARKTPEPKESETLGGAASCAGDTVHGSGIGMPDQSGSSGAPPISPSLVNGEPGVGDVTPVITASDTPHVNGAKAEREHLSSASVSNAASDSKNESDQDQGVLEPARADSDANAVPEAEPTTANPDTPSGTPPDFDDDEDPTPEIRKALRAFWERTTLTEPDRAGLLTKRGLTQPTCEAMGLRSNEESNREILLRLGDEFNPKVLVAAGLWSKKEKEQPKPNAQFYGWGVVGKNPSYSGEGDESKKWLWDWKDSGRCNPILIPYFSPEGEIVQIRPHKGQGKGVAPRLYVVRTIHPTIIKRRLAVLTEGEHKAQALWQVLGKRIAVASVPGISQTKHWGVSKQILAWLREAGATTVVVVFDNEEKGDPLLPSYKPDAQSRLDAEIWARYAAAWLQGNGYVSKVGHLPKEWRDAKGKADWDGALARYSGESVEADFWKIIANAQSITELRESTLFDSEEDQLIKCGVSRLFYVPRLPVGGTKEWRLAAKLALATQHEAMQTAELAGPRFCMESLASAYRRLTGRYYDVKPLTDKKLTEWRNLRDQFDRRNQGVLTAAADIVTRGVPDPVSDFYMVGHFVVVNLDGTRDRMVVLRNVHGETSRLVPLDARALSLPRDLREWLANHGGFAWNGNQTHLQAAHEDMNTAVAGSTVRQVAAYGWDDGTGLWFHKDAAFGYTPEGKAFIITPDGHGVFWHNGIGYLLTDKGKEKQSFRQGTPMMHPTAKLELEMDTLQFRRADLSPEPESILFREVCERMRLAVGGLEAYGAVAIVGAYYAGPEIFQHYGAFPNLLIHGQTSSGKTSFASWLLEFNGFQRRTSGIGLVSNCSIVGLKVAMEQYSNQPLWLDEYKSEEEILPGIRGAIHATYNRGQDNKFQIDGEMRLIRTNVIVCGEVTPADGSDRNRFFMVQTAAERRLGTREEQVANFDWLQRNRTFFFTIGRTILLHRTEFAASVLRHLRAWRESPEVKAVEERCKFVHGVAYASFYSLVELFQSHLPSEISTFRTSLLEQCVRSVATTAVHVNANRFWYDLLAAFKAGAFGHTKAEMREVFRVFSTYVDHPPCAPDQGAWRNYKLFIEYNAMLDRLRRHLHVQGKELSLERSDLAAQLSKKDYWIPGPKDGHRQRFGQGSAMSPCWAIDLDRHELGYRLVPTPELDQARFTESGMLLPNWGDPRKGELFALIEALEQPDQTGQE